MVYQKQEIKRQRRLSAPQLSSQTQSQTKQIQTTATTGNLKRSHSSPMLVHKQNTETYVPKASVTRDRRMSTPGTPAEFRLPKTIIKMSRDIIKHKHKPVRVFNKILI